LDHLQARLVKPEAVDLIYDADESFEDRHTAGSHHDGTCLVGVKVAIVLTITSNRSIASR
jgi:hypothetical protein